MSLTSGKSKFAQFNTKAKLNEAYVLQENRTEEAVVVGTEL